MEFLSFNLNVIPTTQVLLLGVLGILSWILLRTVLPPRVKNGKLPPGPIGLPIVGYLPFLGKEPHKKVFKMREKYGDIIGLYLGTKYTVTLNEYNVMKEVLSHPGALDRDKDVFGLVSAGFGVENGEKWIEQRRFCLTAVRDVGLGRGCWEEMILDSLTNFTAKLEATNGKAVDVSHDLAASLTSDIFSLLMGRRLMEDKEADKIQLYMDFSAVVFQYLGPSLAASVIPGLRKFCEVFRIAGYDRVSRIVQNFSAFIRKEIDHHKYDAASKENHDFINIYLEKLSKLAKSRSEKHYFSEAMLEGNVNSLFIGSTDTVLNSLIWLLRFMVAHKDVQQKVYTELIEAVGEHGRARYQEKENIPYTFATIMEAQRVSSMVPFTSSRRTNQEIHIKGITIPKGSDVTANLWALHHDPNYWKEPEVFRPDRFLKENGTKLVTQYRSYLPFSIGRRNCPGKTIAYIALVFYFSEIMKKFEVCLPPGVEPEFKTIPGLVTGLEPQPLCFKKRRDDI